ncbi:MAG: 4a-hydroxytetrahydrobiopterin dehydratase [Flavobacteriia bacterium]|nr:4a-hydroxytetrahydrobiopterin dehydratase [Flavobacteriia bacterium]
MNWKIVNNRLVKEYHFKNQTELAIFFLKVAKLADSMNHHPDVSVFQCSKLKLELFTHTVNKISDLDQKLAKSIDLIN